VEAAGGADHPPARRRDGAERLPRQFDELGYPYGEAEAAVGFYGAARSEAASVHGLDIHLIGAGNSAGQAALFFANHARSVTILCRSGGLEKSMSRYLIDQIAARPNIRTLYEAEVVAAHGELSLDAIDVRNRVTGRIGSTRRGIPRSSRSRSSGGDIVGPKSIEPAPRGSEHRRRCATRSAHCRSIGAARRACGEYFGRPVKVYRGQSRRLDLATATGALLAWPSGR
jgi:Pyridine nucleotide-disulphide oxidoreductase